MLVSQLFNQDGQLYSYSEFLQRYGIPVTPREFSIVFDAIPTGVIALFRGFRADCDLPVLCNVLDTDVGKSCFSPHCKNINKIIRQLFQHDIISTPSSLSHWSSFVGDIC